MTRLRRPRSLLRPVLPTACSSSSRTSAATSLLTAAEGGHAREAHRARRPHGQAAHDRGRTCVSSCRSPRAYSGLACRFLDLMPGGNARTEPCRREVRLAPRLQVLGHTQPGGSASRCRARWRTMRARFRVPVHVVERQQKFVARIAAARGRARPRADEGRARRGDRTSDCSTSTRPLGAAHAFRLVEPERSARTTRASSATSSRTARRPTRSRRRRSRSGARASGARLDALPERERAHPRAAVSASPASRGRSRRSGTSST